MKDRVPLHPGRVTLTPVSGQANTYDMVRADQPTQEGTPLGKAALFNSNAEQVVFGEAAGDHTPAEAFTRVGNRLDVIEPIGTIKTTARTDLGDKWLLCNGDAIDPASYPDLAKLLKSDPSWNWSLVNLSTGTKVSLKQIAYGNGYYVACGYGLSYIAYTTDPTGTWTLKQISSSSYIYLTGIAYGNGYFVMCGYNSNNYYDYIYYATDPAGTWTAKSFSTDDTTIKTTHMRYVNGYFVMCRESGNIYYATDPTGTWTTKAVNLTLVYDITYGNGYFVACGFFSQSGRVAISYATDLAGTWTRKVKTATYTQNLYGITYADGYFVACGYYGSSSAYYDYIYYATDPTGTWTYKQIGTAMTVWGITHGNGYFVICGQKSSAPEIAYSTDPASDWTFLELSSNSFCLYDVEFLNGWFLGCGTGSDYPWVAYLPEYKLPEISLGDSTYTYIRALEE